MDDHHSVERFIISRLGIQKKKREKYAIRHWGGIVNEAFRVAVNVSSETPSIRELSAFNL